VKGFEDEDDLLDHFEDHASSLYQRGVLSELTVAEYLSSAIRFMSEPVGASDVTLELERASNGDRVRYRADTREFGVVCRCGFIHSYFIPDVAFLRPSFDDELQYFRSQEHRRFPARECCRSRGLI
jgi:hypothetical protein